MRVDSSSPTKKERKQATHNHRRGVDTQGESPLPVGPLAGGDRPAGGRAIGRCGCCSFRRFCRMAAHVMPSPLRPLAKTPRRNHSYLGRRQQQQQQLAPCFLAKETPLRTRLKGIKEYTRTLPQSALPQLPRHSESAKLAGADGGRGHRGWGAERVLFKPAAPANAGAKPKTSNESHPSGGSFKKDVLCTHHPA